MTPMHWLTFCLLLKSSAKAMATQSEMQIILNKPIDERVLEFRQRGAEAFGFLRRLARDSTAALPLRWRAITTMGRLNAKQFHDAIEKSLADREWFVRNAALIALLNQDHERAVRGSLRLLNDPALVVRTQSVRNLIALNARESEPSLWKAIFDKRNFKGREGLWIRPHLAEALAKFSGPGRANAFKRLLLDEDERLHKWAVIGLEASTGVVLSDHKEPVEIQRQKWLARLSASEI